MIALPWSKTTVPHCVLEITQQCNLACKACYRNKPERTTTLDTIRADLEILEAHQRVQTVFIAGGEPTCGMAKPCQSAWSIIWNRALTPNCQFFYCITRK